MANTKSAKKMVRKIARRTALNKTRKTRMRGFIRKFEEAVLSGDKDAAELAFRAVQPEIARAGQKGVVHRKAASRKVSRLSKRLQSL